jgi:hypothetical protein
VAGKDKEFRSSRKKRLISWMLRDIVSEKIYEGVSEHVKASEFESLVDRIYRRETDPYTVADETAGRMKKSI